MPRYLGQHFLKRGAVINRILKSLKLGENDRVLEIGPGRGALTQPLADQVARLVLVEKDERLAAALAEKYAASDRVSVLAGDFLLLGWDEIAARLGADGYKIVSNLPYEASTAILVKLLENAAPATEMALMFQKEVAARIASPTRRKDYGSLSVFCQLTAEIRPLFDVPPAAFAPPPKVDSSVLHFRIRENPLIAKPDWPDFEALLQAGFRQRRKMLRQNLRTYFSGDTAEAVETRLETVGANRQARAEELDLEQWALLWRLSH